MLSKKLSPQNPIFFFKFQKHTSFFVIQLLLTSPASSHAMHLSVQVSEMPNYSSLQKSPCCFTCLFLEKVSLSKMCVSLADSYSSFKILWWHCFLYVKCSLMPSLSGPPESIAHTSAVIRQPMHLLLLLLSYDIIHICPDMKSLRAGTVWCIFFYVQAQCLACSKKMLKNI